MGTKNNAIQQHNAELIPSSELPEFEKAIGQLQTIEASLAPIEQKAKALTVAWPDPTGYTEAGALLKELKDADSLSTAAMKPYDVILDRVRDFIKTKKLRIKNKAEQIRASLELKMTDYKREELAATKREKEEEQRKTNEENARKANEKKAADEQAAREIREQKVNEIRGRLKRKEITARTAERLLKEAGAMEESMKAKAAADAEEQKNNPPEVKVAANLPKLPGRQTTRYYAECTDRDAFIAAFFKDYLAVGKLSPMYRHIQVSNQELSVEAREVKDDEKMQAKYPGIRAWSEFGFGG